MQNLVQKGVEIFSSSRKQPIFLPKLKTVCKITKSAEITLQDTLITELSAKRRSQKLKQPCIDERSEELAGTGAILGESLFGLILLTKLFSQSYFWCK